MPDDLQFRYMNNVLLTAVRHELEQQVDLMTRDGVHAFFKERVLVYGVKTPIVSRIAREFFTDVKPLGKAKAFTLCEELFKSDYMEEAFIASEWAYWLRDEYSQDDFSVFERWLNGYVNNWAKCDSLCNHAIGSFVEQFPTYVESLKAWARSENRWVRRGASVTLILPARRGMFLKDIFEIADILLTDKDDLVQKGYGWMLKEASRMHQQEVLDYVIRNKEVMPRTALRYAIEKVPMELRRLAMQRT